MKLEYTDEERAFRAEVRAWMEANVPKHKLPSFDLTREGFEALATGSACCTKAAGAWSPGRKSWAAAVST